MAIRVALWNIDSEVHLALAASSTPITIVRKCSLVIRGRRKSARRLWPVFGATALVAAMAFVSLAAPPAGSPNTKTATRNPKAAPPNPEIAPRVDPQAAPLADLKTAVAQLQGKQSGNGVGTLKPLVTKLPKLADYISWIIASAQFDASSYADVPATLAPVWAQSPPSPLISRAALLASRADLQTGRVHEALEVLRKYYDKLPQPQADLAMATAFSADGDAISAAVYDQRVYYGYPASSEAAQAETDLARLRAELGERYPPAMGNVMLGRAVKLLELGQTEKAGKEFLALIPQLGGTDRDEARVKIGVADYDRKDTVAAQKYFESLELDAGETDAERLHYLLLCARRRNDRAAMNALVERISENYPNSVWRLESLWALANANLIENQAADYEPLYRACYESFSNDPRAAECHWKVAWAHYLRRSEDAADYLREHLTRFPASDSAPAALYFLGRLAQSSDDVAAARVYYDEIAREYPNHYYAALARERLASPAVSSTGARPAVARTSKPDTNTFDTNQAADFLRMIAFPSRVHARDFQANAVTKARLERARMLAAAGLDDWAEIELRYAAQNEDQPHVIALELATEASGREAYPQGLRYLKRYASDYLYYPVDSAPADFWRLAFPMPFRADFERSARERNLDPFLLAAVARQESEFDPKAVSRSSARGLTQILPSTGRELSRRLQIKPFSTARLFQPSVNLQLGAYYLRSIADSFDGRWEATLAGYNAGPVRARAWLTWAEFREPAEFVETIPFRETRNYVQIVLRNADMYRRIYGPTKAPVKTASTTTP
ncbi:MAG TPA: transglycosylase SLT domain-containing protein [Bryobacteraceae bacterium]|nr:transglycosylase SLT domain-containing protein [Bryobacteraceae bacterium]